MSQYGLLQVFLWEVLEKFLQDFLPEFLWEFLPEFLWQFLQEFLRSSVYFNNIVAHTVFYYEPRFSTFFHFL